MPQVPEAVGAGEAPPTEILEDLAPDELFSLRHVHEVRIRLAPGGRDALRADPTEPVAAVVEVDGVVRAHASARLKGSNSFRTIDEKPSWRLRLDARAEGETLAGLSRLVLNNMVSDPTQGREVVAWNAWADAGLAGPRAAFARVRVDDDVYGLYAMLEGLDERWLARQGDDGTGTLWEGNDGADLTASGIAAFEVAGGQGDTTHLRAAAEALAADGDFLERAEPWVDTDSLLTGIAWVHLLGNMDGYPMSLDDMYLWEAGPERRYRLVPWGLDETWDPTWTWQWGVGRLSVGCNRDRDCREALLDRLDRELGRWDALDVPRRARELFTLTDPLVAADPRSGRSPIEVTLARGALLGTLDGWHARVRASAWPP
jgi:spore coat protein CotH